MDGTKFPNLDKAKAINKLQSEIKFTLQLLIDSVKHPVDKEYIRNYFNILNHGPDSERNTHFFSKRKGTRALQPYPMLCVYALINALFEAEWKFLDNEELEANKCYDILTELQNIANTGINNHQILGNLVEGFYLYRL